MTDTFTLTGRLLDKSKRPIKGASINLDANLDQVSDALAAEVYLTTPTVVTDNDGYLCRVVNGGPDDNPGVTLIVGPQYTLFSPDPARVPLNRVSFSAPATGNTLDLSALITEPPATPPTFADVLAGVLTQVQLVASEAASDATAKADAAQEAAEAAVDALALVVAGKQPADADLAAIAALTTTTTGRALLTIVDAAAGRAQLGLGSAALQPASAFDAAGAASAAVASLTAGSPAELDTFLEAYNRFLSEESAAQVLNATVAGIRGATDSSFITAVYAALQPNLAASFTQKANNLADLPSAATARTNLGLGSIATFPISAVPSVWTANTVYTAGRLLVSPTGDVIRVVSPHTSGASYDSSLYALSSSYALASQVLPKVSVRVAATSNVSLTAPGASIDGVALVSGNRVLLTGQTAAAENGVYVWTGPAATMTRATDMSTAATLVGAFLYVNAGRTQAGAGWENTNTTITLGTTAVTFAQFYAPPPSLAGPASYRSGNYYWTNSPSGRGSGAALAFGTPRSSQWTVYAPLTVTSFTIEMTAAGDAASVFRIGVWADDGAGLPSTPILDAGTISGGTGNAGQVATGGTPGVYEIVLATPLTLQPGIYWAGGANQGTGTPPTIICVAPNSIPTQFPLGTAIPTTPAAAPVGVVGSTQAGAFTTFAGSAANASIPRIGFKVL